MDNLQELDRLGISVEYTSYFYPDSLDLFAMMKLDSGNLSSYGLPILKFLLCIFYSGLSHLGFFPRAFGLTFIIKIILAQ